MTFDYSVIVVGGGHAGLEAAMAAANMGEPTLLITLNTKKMGNLPCNPSIGGSAKGIVVREIDALGGQMAKAADHQYLQMKMLNTGKGPGVQCLRSQSDKILYPAHIQSIAFSTPNLTIIETMVVDVLHDESTVFGVIDQNGKEYTAKAVVLTTGTYMESEILVGHKKFSAGPDGEKPSRGLSPALAKMGIELMRLKTGTPPRIKRSSIDFSKTTIQLGTPGNLAFSYETTTFIPMEQQEACYLTYTTEETHKIINDHLLDSSMYSGLVHGVGPRYCPSIEDKIVRFADKERHQLFLEPESRNSESIYLQGFSTSMPEHVQEKMVRSLPGLENAEFLKYAYAIEYDSIDPLQLKPTLELLMWKNLYIAGQICGTSGYEEAAGLGLMAGINAVLKIRSQNPLILRRDQAYIGVMIDDIVTKGIADPYRLLSSRAEYRLLLRHDNADIRLLDIGHQVGLISDQRYNKFNAKMDALKQAENILNTTYLGPKEDLVAYLTRSGYPNFTGGLSGAELLKRPGITYLGIRPFIFGLENIELDETAIMQLEVIIKYEGYIVKQMEEAKRSIKLESMKIPADIDYVNLDGLALEARAKLNKIKPETIGQASRVSGVNPSDISILILYLKRVTENDN